VALTRYLEDGDLAIDNKRTERCLRGIDIGRNRNNWTFLGSDRSGRQRLNAWLPEAGQGLGVHVMVTEVPQLRELLPCPIRIHEPANSVLFCVVRRHPVPLLGLCSGRAKH
jgi:hypothetical protein